MPSDVPKETLELLAAFPWEEKIPRLLFYASHKARKKRWRSVFDGHLPEGKEVQDVVSHAIEKILSGERKWNPQEQPDLFRYVMGIIDSELNHLAECLENRMLLGEPDIDGNSLDTGDKGAWIDSIPSSTPDPEMQHIIKEEDSQSEAFFLGFYDFLAGKPLLQGMIECIDDGIDKKADMAQKLGVHVQEIYNASKQLKRKLEEFRNTWKS